MNRSAQFLLVSCFMLFLIGGCSKPYKKADPGPSISTNPGPGPSTFPQAPGPSLNELFKEFRSTPEVQCVTAGTLQIITFAKGTRLTFYPNSFKDAAGAIITSGTVCMEMIEMYKPGDMIANRATTTTKDGELLRSGGQVSINATKDGQKVYANIYGIAFRQPAASLQPMDLYYGNTANEDSVVKWQVFPDSEIGGTRSDSGSSAGGASENYYIFDSCTNITFINCDRILDYTSPRTPVNVVMLDTGYNFSNTQLFLILHELNVSAGGFRYSSSTNTFNVGDDHKLHQVPIGLSATLVIMCNKNGNYFYFEKKGLTITEGMTITATPTKQSLDDIKAKLSAL